MNRKNRRQLIWTALFAVAVGVLLILLVLIGTGYLRLPGTPHPAVTVTAVDWTIEQGSNSHGQPWFGKSQFNYSGISWVPPTYSAGTRFHVSWSIVNYDNVTHEIYGVSIGAPFLFVCTQVPLPMTVVVGDEGGNLVVNLTTTSSTSGSYILNITVNALSSVPGSPGC